MIRKLTHLIPNPGRDVIYEILELMPPQLCVDVGAAAADTALKMRNSNGVLNQIVAFEPFPPNWPFFERATKNIENVRLVRKAVSYKIGSTEFIVGAISTGKEEGWEDYAGYSSVGFLSRSRMHQARLFLSAIRARLRGKKPALRLRVDTTTIDSEFPNEHIGFLKADVQGGEAQVLRGSELLLSEQRIDLLYVEWLGDPDVQETLERHGYHLFDSDYVGVSHIYGQKVYEERGFEVISTTRLSTGQEAFEMIYRGEEDIGELLRSLNRAKIGWIQTDLLAVSPSRLKELEKNCSTIQGRHLSTQSKT